MNFHLRASHIREMGVLVCREIPCHTEKSRESSLREKMIVTVVIAFVSGITVGYVLMEAFVRMKRRSVEAEIAQLQLEIRDWVFDPDQVEFTPPPDFDTSDGFELD